MMFMSSGCLEQVRQSACRDMHRDADNVTNCLDARILIFQGCLDYPYHEGAQILGPYGS